MGSSAVACQFGRHSVKKLRILESKAFLEAEAYSMSLVALRSERRSASFNSHKASKQQKVINTGKMAKLAPLGPAAASGPRSKSKIHCRAYRRVLLAASIHFSRLLLLIFI